MKNIYDFTEILMRKINIIKKLQKNKSFWYKLKALWILEVLILKTEALNTSCNENVQLLYQKLSEILELSFRNLNRNLLKALKWKIKALIDDLWKT